VRGGAVPLLAPPSLLARDTAAAVRAAVAQRPPVAADTFAIGPVRARAYRAGPRRYSLLPLGTVSPDGGVGGLQLAALDPAGRLSVLAQAAAGDPRPWSGGSARASWRGSPVALTGELFAARQDLGARAANAGVVVPAALAGANTYRGATLVASAGRWIGSRAHALPGAPPAAGADTARARSVAGPRDPAPDVRISGRLGLHAGRGSASAVGSRGWPSPRRP
jgi:hypothetical protein